MRPLLLLLLLPLLPSALGGNCSAGTFSADGTDAAGACTLCPAGGYATGEAATACTSCAAGKYWVLPVGEEENDNEDFHASAAKCTDCPVGKYLTDAATDAALHDDVADCSDCTADSPGVYSPAGSTACIMECPAGTFTTDGSVTCTVCPQDTYSTAAGATECTTCPSTGGIADTTDPTQVRNRRAANSAL